MRDTLTSGAQTPDHATLLSVLARTAPDAIKAEADAVLPLLGAVDVIQSRTGLVMLPMRDTAQGGDFHLGEVLVAEAHIRAAGVDGYGMTTGRDLEQAMAMALLDAAWSGNVARDRVTGFANRMAAAQARQDHDTLCNINATRVEMETF